MQPVFSASPKGDRRMKSTEQQLENRTGVVHWREQRKPLSLGGELKSKDGIEVPESRVYMEIFVHKRSRWVCKKQE